MKSGNGGDELARRCVLRKHVRKAPGTHGVASTRDVQKNEETETPWGKKAKAVDNSCPLSNSRGRITPTSTQLGLA